MAFAEDPASVLEQFIHDSANLPAEIAHLYEEMEAKDRLIHECSTSNGQRDGSLQKFIKQHGSLVKNPKEESYDKTIMENHENIIKLREEKFKLAARAYELV